MWSHTHHIKWLSTNYQFSSSCCRSSWGWPLPCGGLTRHTRHEQYPIATILRVMNRRTATDPTDPTVISNVRSDISVPGMQFNMKHTTQGLLMIRVETLPCLEQAERFRWLFSDSLLNVQRSAVPSLSGCPLEIVGSKASVSRSPPCEWECVCVRERVREREREREREHVYCMSVSSTVWERAYSTYYI